VYIVHGWIFQNQHSMYFPVNMKGWPVVYDDGTYVLYSYCGYTLQAVQTLCIVKSESYGTQTCELSSTESSGGCIRGQECGWSVSSLFCIPTSVYYFFSQSPTITEIFHNRLHLHHCRQCHSVVQVLSEEKSLFLFVANS
jgi:hypothetical protein